MTVPRELHLKTTTEGERLGQRFVPELVSEQGWKHHVIVSESLAIGAELVLAGHREGAKPQYGTLNFTLNADSCAEIYLSSSLAPDLIFKREGKALMLTYQRSGENGRDAFDKYYSYEFELPVVQRSSLISLEWVVDHGSLELLINDGIYSLTSLLFNNPSDVGLAAPKMVVRRGGVVVESAEHRVLL